MAFLTGFHTVTSVAYLPSCFVGTPKKTLLRSRVIIAFKEQAL